eukprot:14504714-Alexandrium_andersonii.AAC.1
MIAKTKQGHGGGLGGLGTSSTLDMNADVQDVLKNGGADAFKGLGLQSGDVTMFGAPEEEEEAEEDQDSEDGEAGKADSGPDEEKQPKRRKLWNYEKAMKEAHNAMSDALDTHEGS